jgi:glutamate racemase
MKKQGPKASIANRKTGSKSAAALKAAALKAATKHPTSSTPRIAVLDSGIGGLSIVQKLLPMKEKMEVIYLMDNRFLPYGEKTDPWIKQRCLALGSYLQDAVKADILLLACNTASTIALPHLRQHLHIPVVGVVPAIKVAAEQSQSNCIGLLATKATVSRSYVDQLVAQFAPDHKVIRFAAQEMVAWAEDVFVDKTIDEAAFARVLAEFFALAPPGMPMDGVVLGCTHFAFLIPHLDKLVPYPIRWIDSADAVCRRLVTVLAEERGFSLEPTKRAPPWTLLSSETLSDQLREKCELMGFETIKHL